MSHSFGSRNVKSILILIIIFSVLTSVLALAFDKKRSEKLLTKQQVPLDLVPTLPSSFGAVIEKNGKAYLIGGWSDFGMHSSVLCIENCGQVIRKLVNESPWAKRSYFSAVKANRFVYLFGGFQLAPPSNVLGDIWSSIDLVNWKLEAIDPAWEQREAHGVVYHKKFFYLFGGVTYFRPDKSSLLGALNTSHLRVLSDVWRSRDGFEWVRLTNRAPWGPRRNFSYAVKDGYIWLWGGINDETGQIFNDVWRSHDGAYWEVVTNQAPWSPRMVNNHIGVFKNKLWTIGGGGDPKVVSGLNDVWSSDDGQKWDLVTDNADFSPRNGAYVFPIKCNSEEFLFMFGGMNDFSGIKDSDPRRRVFYRDLWSSKNGKKWERLDYIVKSSGEP